MVAYVVARMTVHDVEKMREYARLASAHTHRFGGKYLVRGGELTNLEGTICDGRIVVAQFPDKASAIAMFTDQDYCEVAKLRQAAATTHMLTVIDGVEYTDLPSSGV